MAPKSRIWQAAHVKEVHASAAIEQAGTIAPAGETQRDVKEQISASPKADAIPEHPSVEVGDHARGALRRAAEVDLVRSPALPRAVGPVLGVRPSWIALESGRI